MKHGIRAFIAILALGSSSLCATAWGMDNAASNRPQIEKTLVNLSQVYIQLISAENNLTEAQNSLTDGRKLRTFQERALLQDRVQRDQLSIQENLKQANWDLNYLNGQWGSLTSAEKNSVEKIESSL